MANYDELFKVIKQILGERSMMDLLQEPRPHMSGIECDHGFPVELRCPWCPGGSLAA